MEPLKWKVIFFIDMSFNLRCLTSYIKGAWINNRQLSFGFSSDPKILRQLQNQAFLPYLYKFVTKLRGILLVIDTQWIKTTHYILFNF